MFFGPWSLPVEKKQISPFAASKGRHIPTWNRPSSRTVLTPIIRLGGVDDSWFQKKNWEIQFLLRLYFERLFK